jgi:bacillithiol biosynthesis deacetylase BshB1
MPVEILALAAHRDDVEQTCAGTLLKMAERGYRTGILDLTRGEMGTRGSAEDRAREAAEAARLLKVSWRQALDIPDGRVENTWENRLKVARVLREQRPRVLILPYWEGRHPDHYTASILGYESAFLSGLSKLKLDQTSTGSNASNAVAGRAVADHVRADHAVADNASERALADALAEHALKGRGFSRAAETSETSGALAPEVHAAHRPFKIIYASLYRDVRPTFIVDITDQFETRFASLMAYKSQFTDQEAGSGIFPAQKEIRARIESMARFYGMMGGVTYAEPFVQKEVGLVDDVMSIPVKSI